MQYFDEILKACGIAVVCVILLVLLRTTASGITVAVRIGGVILIFGVFLYVLSDSIGALDAVISLASEYGGTGLSKTFSVMLKALGIALMSKLCADICRDCGESTLAGGVEGVGRIAIFSLSLPIITEIIEYAVQMLKM